MTTLFVDGAEALEDIARFVGHAKPTTTAGYVKRLGRRPEAVARRAAAILDAQADEDSLEVRNHSGSDGSYRESDAPEPPTSLTDRSERPPGQRT